MKQSECESGADGKKKVKNLDFEGQVDGKKKENGETKRQKEEEEEEEGEEGMR